jgi:RNA polymerase sigma-70 factor, ECF subfamily
MAIEIALLIALSLARTDEDRSLADALRRGEPAALRRLFDRYHDGLRRHILRQGFREDVADEVTQIAFITLWDRRATIDPDKSVRALLFRIAHTRALNEVRDRRRYQGADDLSAFERVIMPEDPAWQRQIQAALHAAIEALPDRRRAVFELCYLEGFTYPAAAEVLGISPKTVENQMAQALKILRTALAPYDEKIRSR